MNGAVLCCVAVIFLWLARNSDSSGQMITAFPDITVTELGPTDEFFVMACDGIWNSMESAEVVEFVRTRLHKGGISPEAIMEEVGGLA